MKTRMGLVLTLSLLPLSLFAADDVAPATSEDIRAFDQAVGAARAEAGGTRAELRSETRDAVKTAAEHEVREAREARESGKVEREKEKSEKPSREFVHEQKQRDEMRSEMNALRNDTGRLEHDSVRDQVAGSGKDDKSHDSGGSSDGGGSDH